MLIGIAFEMKLYGTHNFAPLDEIPNMKNSFWTDERFLYFCNKKNAWKHALIKRTGAISRKERAK